MPNENDNKIIPDDKQPTPPGTPPDPPKGISKEEVEQMLANARKEEKAKLHDTLERERKQREELEKKLKDEQKAKEEAVKKAAAAEETVTKLQEGQATEALQKQLDEMKAQNADLVTRLEGVADAATAEVHKARLEAYREKAVAAAKLTELADLVTGNSMEEIDAAIAKAKAKEEAIASRAAEATKAKYDEERKSNVPTPLAPSNRLSSTVADGKTREQVARMPRDEYEKIRAELMAKAVGG